MTDVERFPAQIPYADSEPCLEVFAAMVAGDWALAQERYEANPAATSNTMGAVRYWRDQFDPGGTPPTGDVIVVDIPWNAPATENPKPPQSGTAGWFTEYARTTLPQFAAEVYAFRFTVPEGGPYPNAGNFSVFEYNGQPALRQSSISWEPGDFVNTIGAVSQGAQSTQIVNRGPQVGAGVLPAGTYYFNVKNANPETNSPAMVEMLWPR